MEHPETIYSASAGVRMLIASRGKSYECAQQRGHWLIAGITHLTE